MCCNCQNTKELEAKLKEKETEIEFLKFKLEVAGIALSLVNEHLKKQIK